MFCSQRCAQHYALLTSRRFSLGMPKRLLELDVDDLDDESIVALLELFYARRETDIEEFRALAEWRLVSARYRRLIDRRIWPRMQSLPDDLSAELDDEILALFPGLRSLKLLQFHFTVRTMYEDIYRTYRKVSDTALQRLNALVELRIVETGIDAPDVDTLFVPPPLADPEVASLTQLTTLHIVCGAHRSTLTTHCVTGLTRLTDLYCGSDMDCTLSDFLLLTRLTRLHLDDTSIDDDLPLPYTLTALTDLTIGHDLGNDSLRHLVHLTRLVFVAIGDANERVTAHGLAHLTNLRELSLDEVAFYPEHDDGSWDDLSLPLLQRLTPGWCPLWRSVPNLPQLTALDLQYTMNITDLELARLTQLRELTFNFVSDEDAGPDGVPGAAQLGPAALAPLTRLETLDLQRNERIDDAALVPLISLRRLDASDTKLVTGACFRALRQLRYLQMKGSAIRLASLVALSPDCIVEGASWREDQLERDLKNALRDNERLAYSLEQADHTIQALTNKR